MHISEEQVQRYFGGSCSQEEEKQIQQYFIQHPEMLEKYLTEESWEQYNREADGVAERREQQKARVRKLPLRWMVAAAAVILAIACGWWLFVINKPAGHTLARVTDNARILQEERVNSSDTVQQILLSDGSQVQLSPGGKLTYNNTYSLYKRELHLRGEAVFTVAQNKEKPFIVYSGDLSTTALGTVFRISETKGNIVVKLYSGKVVVKHTHVGDTAKAVYLQPMQQLAFNLQRHTVIVNGFTEHSTEALALKRTTHTILSFADKTLPEVFSTISGTFKIEIVYNAAALKDMTFTGRLDTRKETVADFIKTIALLNNLQVKNVAGRIILTQ